MKNDLRRSRFQRGLQAGDVAEIGLVVRGEQIANATNIEIAGRRRRGQGIARDLGPQGVQPDRQPGALEARVSRDEDASDRPKLRIADCKLQIANFQFSIFNPYHTFQGA